MCLEPLLVAALYRHLAGGKPVVPVAGRLLWSIFVDLSNARGGNGFGPNPISHSEMDAYCRLNRWPLEQHHVAILRAMDEAWMAHAAKAATDQSAPAVSSEPLTLELFDALFE